MYFASPVLLLRGMLSRGGGNMETEFDMNKVTADVITQCIGEFFRNGKGFLNDSKDKVLVKLKVSYTAYMESTFAKYSKTKTFFIRNEPTYLYDFYVPAGLKSPGRKIKNASFDEILKINNCCIVCGTAGSGKSTLMRHLLLQCVAAKNKVPVFIELKDINDFDGDFVDLIRSVLVKDSARFSKVFIESAIKAGHFTFILDGYDEVNEKKRKKIRTEIQAMAKRCPDNNYIVSSRPDSEFGGWETFTVFKMLGLSLEQACLLVNKLPFSGEIKDKFVLDLRKGMFEKHESFLSNPLLLSIMLLTYGQSADIPTKLNVFYNQAYEALFQCHDALKGAFQRERETSLDIQDFAEILNCFSLQTYDKRELNFSRTKALSYLKKTKSITKINFKEENFLNDALTSVCLIVEDGLFLTFSHRSFQEYFTAKFIINSSEDKQAQLLQKYSKHFETDNVIQLVHEIDSKLVEKYVFLPYIDNLEKKIGIKKTFGITHYLNFFKLLFTEVSIANGSLMFVGKTGLGYNISILAFLLKSYGNLIGVDFGSKYHGTNALIAEKYGTVGKRVTIKVSEFTIKNQLFIDLTANKSVFSMEAMQDLFKIKKVIIDDHKSFNSSLDDILNL